MKPRRGVLPTPPRPSKDVAQERTRQTFFTKVRQAGDERTWQSRSDLVKTIIHACEGTLTNGSVDTASRLRGAAETLGRRQG